MFTQGNFKPKSHSVYHKPLSSVAHFPDCEGKWATELITHSAIKIPN